MKKKNILFTILAITIFSLLLQLLMSKTGIWINLTSSMPPGIYLQQERSFNKNDYVISCLPKEASVISHERGYLGYGKCYMHTAPVGKKLIALEGDHALIDERGIHINGELLKNTSPMKYDGEGRAMSHAHIKRKLEKNEILLALDNPRSFDSRYFGVVPRENLQAKIVPLYLF